MPAGLNAIRGTSHSSGSRGSSRGRGAGGRGRGSRGRRGRGGYCPYEPPIISATRTLHFRELADWDEAMLDAPGIEQINFGVNFNVQDHHLLAIYSRPVLAASLKALSLGDSDTGNGAQITDAAVIGLSNACPNLRVLKLDAVTRVTDTAFIACCQACTKLELLQVTGNDKVKGSIRDAALRQPKVGQDLAPNLKELVLYDQSCYSGVEALSRKRKTLAIKTGDTVGDGYAANMIADETGDGVLFTYVGGKIII